MSPHLQVEKYMQSLPTECIPALGTEGENYRRKQCFLQVPLYDFSLDACHKMSDLETKRYAKLTTKRRENCFGVGALKLQSTEDSLVCVRAHTHAHTHTLTLASYPGSLRGGERAWYALFAHARN